MTTAQFLLICASVWMVGGSTAIEKADRQVFKILGLGLTIAALVAAIP